MASVNAKIVDGEIRFAVDNLLTDEVQRELCKRSVFDAVAVEGICKMLVSGKIHWDDDETGLPWYVHWSGKGDVYENARKAILELSDDIVKKLVSDITTERDRMFVQLQEQRETLSKLRRENEYLRQRMSEVNK